MPETARYFKVPDHVGLDADGNPEPAHEIGLGMQVTDVEMVDDPLNPGRQIVTEVVRPETVTLKPIPGTRLFKVAEPLVAEALAVYAASTGIVEEVEPPTKRDLDKDRKATQDAREHAGTHTEPGENDDIDTTRIDEEQKA